MIEKKPDRASKYEPIRNANESFTGYPLRGEDAFKI
jgi:hypothetical protein